MNPRSGAVKEGQSGLAVEAVVALVRSRQMAFFLLMSNQSTKSERPLFRPYEMPYPQRFGGVVAIEQRLKLQEPLQWKEKDYSSGFQSPSVFRLLTEGSV